MTLLKKEKRDGCTTYIYRRNDGATVECIHRRGWSARVRGPHGDGKWTPWPDGCRTRKEALSLV